MKPTCVNGCEAQIHAKGLCSKCYDKTRPKRTPEQRKKYWATYYAANSQRLNERNREQRRLGNPSYLKSGPSRRRKTPTEPERPRYIVEGETFAQRMARYREIHEKAQNKT